MDGSHLVLWFGLGLALGVDAEGDADEGWGPIPSFFSELGLQDYPPNDGPQVSFAMHRVAVDYRQGLISVPVGIWWRPDVKWHWGPPLEGVIASPESTYPYRIDVGRIATNFKQKWLSWAPSRNFRLPRGASPLLPAPAGRRHEAIVFAHGFLGSPFDMAHVCERLAADGFVVIAPEFAESLSASYETPQGKFGQQEALALRKLIVDEARKLLSAQTSWGIFGHSVGAMHVQVQPGSFALGRVAIAPGLSEGSIPYSYYGEDPFFVVGSSGDGCFKRSADGEAIDFLIDERLGPIYIFPSPEVAYAGELMPPRGAILFTGSSPSIQQPNHLSFLWSRTNDALLSFLSPLLPIAKALRIFVLDFDVYKKQRDSHHTARRLVPALRRFFVSGAKAWPDSGTDGFRPDFRRANFGRTPELEMDLRRRLQSGEPPPPEAAAEWPHCGAALALNAGADWDEWLAEVRRRVGEAWAAATLAEQATMKDCLGAMGLSLASRLELALARWRAWDGGDGGASAPPAALGAEGSCEALWSGGEATDALILPPLPDFSSKFELPFPFPFPAIPKPEPGWELRAEGGLTEPGWEQRAEGDLKEPGWELGVEGGLKEPGWEQRAKEGLGERIASEAAAGGAGPASAQRPVVAPAALGAAAGVSLALAALAVVGFVRTSRAGVRVAVKRAPAAARHTGR